MLKKTVKYTDYEGKERTDDVYFHLNKGEIIDLLTTSGDYTLDKVLEKIASEKNGKKSVKFFKNLLKKSYGVKTLDGRFEKSKKNWRKFISTEAYSIIFTEIVTDAKKAADFVNGIIPSDLAAEIEKIVKENPDGVPDSLKDYIKPVK